MAASIHMEREDGLFEDVRDYRMTRSILRFQRFYGPRSIRRSLTSVRTSIDLLSMALTCKPVKNDFET